ncbi:TPA: O-antigen ligase C-terminal domain-containing protein [Serratia marcescens]|nr:O-antigen ligase C-terminal domain-containing protein [Serratia marcescens]
MFITTNILIILVTALSLSVLWGRYFTRPPLITTPTMNRFVFGGALLTVPLLYAPWCWFPQAAWRIASLVAGLLFVFSCLQVKYHRRQVYGLLTGLLLLVTLQAVVALLQLFIPGWTWVPLYGRRVYGLFFQPNLLASFVATGLALALMLLVLPMFTLTHIERWRQGVMLLLLVTFSALLVWIQSRVGWLGGSLVSLLFLWCFGRRFPTRCASAGVALLVGVLLGMWGLLADNALVANVSHAHSNLARWTMLRDTLRMVAAKPWLGWGYGGFEYSFQHFRINQTPPTDVTEIARHPHNELLLWLVEGGVISLVGVLTMLMGGLTVVRQAFRHDRHAFIIGHWSTGVPTALTIALVPIALHTQLEFPFYLSTLHFLTFLLLLTLADRLSVGHHRRRLPPTVLRGVSPLLSVLGLSVALLMSFAFTGKQAITQTEAFGMEDIAPLTALPAPSRWIQWDRIDFDEHLNLLMAYNQTGDAILLESYRVWAQTYLTRRIDKNVYANLIQIFRHQARDDLAEHYRQDAVRLFPDDVRFRAAIPTSGRQPLVNRRVTP